MKLLVIDNYDSFTFNLVQYLGELGVDVEVRSNDAPAGAALGPEVAGVLVSPGPGRPERAGASLGVVRRCAEERVPLLGVCLGHQALAMAFGARLRRGRRPVHGKTSPVHHGGVGVFAGLRSPFEATRYHSLVVDPADLPACLAETAHSEDGEIMGLLHRSLPLEGVQFHPESIATELGRPLLANFVARCADRVAA